MEKQLVQVGAPIPLTYQSPDAQEMLIITATLVNNHGEFLESVKLRSIGKGLYQNFEVAMHDYPFVTAIYTTNEPTIYATVSDLFQSIPKPVPPEKILLGEVIRVQKLTEHEGMILGEVQP